MGSGSPSGKGSSRSVHSTFKHCKHQSCKTAVMTVTSNGHTVLNHVSVLAQWHRVHGTAMPPGYNSTENGPFKPEQSEGYYIGIYAATNAVYLVFYIGAIAAMIEVANRASLSLHARLLHAVLYRWASSRRAAYGVCLAFRGLKSVKLGARGAVLWHGSILSRPGKWLIALRAT